MRPLIGNTVEPEHFYFGPPSHRLYGCYHPSRRADGRDSGILLCYPYGYEYIRVHRAFRRLAIQLAGQGFPVLRFDYFGSGDSSGDLEQVRLHHWLEDISLAVEQMKLRSNLGGICLAGIRLGATLAVMTANRLREDANALILWEPVINGPQYLRELAAAHIRWNNDAFPQHQQLSRQGMPQEIIGFPLTADLLGDLQQIDLMADPAVLLADILIVSSESRSEFELYCGRLNQGKERATIEIIDEQELWLEEPYKSLMPVRTLNAIVGWAVDRLG